MSDLVANAGGSASWLTSVEFGGCLGIPERTARWVLKRLSEGRTYKGATAEVRRVTGTGRGRGDAVLLVYAPSIPVAWLPGADAAPCRARAGVPPPKPASPIAVAIAATLAPIGDDAGWRSSLASAVIEATPAGGPERRELVEQLAGRVAFPAGAKRGKPVSAKTIERIVERAERARADGQNARRAVARKQRKDAGARRCFLSEEIDAFLRARGLGDEQLRLIRDRAERLVAGAWAHPSGHRTGWRGIQKFLAGDVAALFAQAGVVVRGQAIDGICRLPRYFIEQKHMTRHRIRAVYAGDATTASAVLEPRIDRVTDGLQPFDVIDIDVRPLDIPVARADGSVKPPRLVAAMCRRTRLMIADLHQPEERESVRREHTARLVARICLEWSVPAVIYIDNGPEVDLGDTYEELCSLVERETGRRPVVKARPYQGQSKAIESRFAAFERSVLAGFPSNIGGKLGRPKKETMGEVARPFPGGMAALTPAVADALRLFNHAELTSGELAGQSPIAILEAAIADGWTATTLAPEDIGFIFSRRTEATVRPGCLIEAFSGRFRCPAAQTYIGRRVGVRMPFLGFSEDDAPAIHLVELTTGRRIGKGREMRFGVLDPAGAEAHEQMAAEARQMRAEMEAYAPAIDLFPRMAETAARLPPDPLIPVGTTARVAPDGKAPAGEAEAPVVVLKTPARKKQDAKREAAKRPKFLSFEEAAAAQEKSYARGR